MPREPAPRDAPIIVDITARLCFPTGPRATRAAAWIRTQCGGTAGVRRVASSRKTSEWIVDARVPRTRFDLEQIRLLIAELTGLAEQHGGALIAWDAARPRRKRQSIVRRINGREVAVVSFDVALVALGLALQALVVIGAAVLAAVVEGGIWLMAGRTSARR